MSLQPVLNYNDVGNGFPVILVHGFCESKELWKDFEKELSQKYRVICPDLPGFGKSPLKKKEFNIRYLADKINELLTDLNISECVMIGHSLGGYVTLAFAEKYEKKLKGIGLFHSTAYPDSPEKKKARNKTIEFIEKHGVETFASSFVPPLFYEKNREPLKETIDWLISVTGSTSKESIIATIKAMRERKNRIEILKNIKVPVLFIIGEEDSAIQLDASLEQASFPDKAVKHILSGTGHMGMFERKEDTLKIVQDFLMLL
ncbi:MAG: alpha/beta hydrolase [Cytophagaceae bacterium]|nr:alpha/beta hydrolase [Cytophagaceae bacterium]